MTVEGGRAVVRSARSRREGRRRDPLTDALLWIGVGAVAAAATEVGIFVHQAHDYAWVESLFPAVALVYVVTGLAAWRRRPGSRLGFLLCAAGGSILLAALAAVDAPFPASLGLVTQTLIFALIIHLLVAFPSGWLRTPVDRAIVAAGYAVSLLLQPPLYLFVAASPLALADRPDLAQAGLEVQRAVGAAVVAAASVVLVRRVRRATPAQRRVLVPLHLYGVFALLFIPVSSAVVETVLANDLAVLAAAQLGVIGLVPLAFALAASRGGFRRTADIAELKVWLRTDDGARPDLEDVLATTLGDPTVRLWFRLPGEEGLVDGMGRSAGPGGLGTGRRDGRGLVEVELGGRPLGAIEYDADLLDRPDEVREAGRVVALALDRQRLAVELRASRARIAVAADDERRRIARDLHDGLQSRLVFLAVKAGTGEDPAALRRGIEAAIDELRELVHDVMPAALTERGLTAAVEDLCDLLPLPVDLRTSGLEERMPGVVETTAYFIVSEAVVYAVKHADPSMLGISLHRRDRHLHVEVDDDGSGRGRLRTGGRGIRGMRDRVQALNGELVIDSAPGRGTRVMAVIPCGS